MTAGGAFVVAGLVRLVPAIHAFLYNEGKRGCAGRARYIMIGALTIIMPHSYDIVNINNT
jgi:hypothetical protein